MIFILKTDFEEVLNNFFRYKEDGYGENNYILRFVHDNLPDDIKSHIGDNYDVVGSVGLGNWADCPYVAILDNDITDSTRYGLYLVYLFKKDMTGVYLSFSWGSYQFNNNKLLLEDAAKEIRNLLNDSIKIIDFDSNPIDLASNGRRPKSYESGSIFFKYYSIEDLPDDEILISDLEKYLELYDFTKKNYDGKYSILLNKSQSIYSEEGFGDGDVQTLKYWLISQGKNDKLWDEFYKKNVVGIGFDEIGDLKKYATKEKLKLKFQEIYLDDSSYKDNVHACWQFVHDMQIGDIIFVKNEKNQIIGSGIVESDYIYDKNKPYRQIRKVKWTLKGKWESKDKLPLNILKDITNKHEFVNNIKELFKSEGNETEVPEVQYPKYDIYKFLDEVYIDKRDYVTLLELLKNKKNLIVQGPPGVGKTFLAKRFAYSIMGVKDINRVMMVQFHQNYSYENFVMGYRPSKEGFELKEGSFYSFCKLAEEDFENDYFFIIDEINRGDLSRIFGELFMLIENDKRGKNNKIRLLYSDESFFIPKNVYIIGLMNTADRSLAMIDYALRRRFSFFDLEPAFESKGFETYQETLENTKFDELIDVIKELNEEIQDDESLGEGFRIGHSYLCNFKPENADEKLNYIIKYELIPLLKEYWFDEQEKIDNWSNKLRSVIDDSK